MTAEAFRKAALALPGAVELAHMNHPDFRVRGKIFASLGYPGDGCGMVKLTPAQQQSFIEKSPDAFEPCKGAWGRNGATAVHLLSVTKVVLQAALEAAFLNIATPVEKMPRRVTTRPHRAPGS